MGSGNGILVLILARVAEPLHFVVVRVHVNVCTSIHPHDTCVQVRGQHSGLCSFRGSSASLLSVRVRTGSSGLMAVAFVCILQAGSPTCCNPPALDLGRLGIGVRGRRYLARLVSTFRFCRWPGGTPPRSWVLGGECTGDVGIWVTSTHTLE